MGQARPTDPESRLAYYYDKAELAEEFALTGGAWEDCMLWADMAVRWRFVANTYYDLLTVQRRRLPGSVSQDLE